MNIFFLSLSLTVKGSYIEQLIRVSDLYNFIRIRIQEIKKFVTDLDPECTLLRIRSRIQTKRIRASKTIFKKLNYILWQKYFYIFSEYKKNIFTENKRKYECLYLQTFTFSLKNNNISVYSQFSVGTWFSLPSDQLVLWIPHPVWSRGWCYGFHILFDDVAGARVQAVRMTPPTATTVMPNGAPTTARSQNGLSLGEKCIHVQRNRGTCRLKHLTFANFH